MLLSAQDSYSIMIIPIFLQGVLSLWASKDLVAGSFEIGPLFCYNMGFRAEFAEDEG
jgi:hypothetical protein